MVFSILPFASIKGLAEKMIIPVVGAGFQRVGMICQISVLSSLWNTS